MLNATNASMLASQNTAVLLKTQQQLFEMSIAVCKSLIKICFLKFNVFPLAKIFTE